MNTNMSKLKGKIAEKGYTQGNVADQIGINRSTFYRKIKENGKSFSIEEAQKMIEFLDLNNGDAISIFFSELVA